MPETFLKSCTWKGKANRIFASWRNPLDVKFSDRQATLSVNRVYVIRFVCVTKQIHHHSHDRYTLLRFPRVISIISSDSGDEADLQRLLKEDCDKNPRFFGRWELGSRGPCLRHEDCRINIDCKNCREYRITLWIADAANPCIRWWMHPQIPYSNIFVTGLAT